MVKCPYCHKQVRIMPDHLTQYRNSCGRAHAKKLLEDLEAVARAHAEKTDRRRGEEVK